MKAFCAEVTTDHKLVAQVQEGHKELQAFFDVQPLHVLNNYLKVKKDMISIVQCQIERMLDTPELMDLIIKKNVG